MTKKKKEIFTRNKEFQNLAKNEDERKQNKETPGVSGKLSGK